jgi:hypothetical protein
VNRLNPTTVRSSRPNKDTITKSDNPNVVRQKPHVKTWQEIVELMWIPLVASNKFGVLMPNEEREQNLNLSDFGFITKVFLEY